MDLIKENFAARLSRNDLQSLPLKARLGQTLERPQYAKWYGQVCFCKHEPVSACFGTFWPLNSRILQTLRLGLPNWTLGTGDRSVLARQSKAWREFALFSFFAAVPCQGYCDLELHRQDNHANGSILQAQTCFARSANVSWLCAEQRERWESCGCDRFQWYHVRHQGTLKKCKMMHCIQMLPLLSI